MAGEYKLTSRGVIVKRGLTVDRCIEIATLTEGLSGREISKLGVAWQVSTN